MKRLMCEISSLIVILLRLHVKRDLRYDVKKSHLFTKEGRNNNYVTSTFLFIQIFIIWEIPTEEKRTIIRERKIIENSKTKKYIENFNMY
jgi:hypothetical protein